MPKGIGGLTCTLWLDARGSPANQMHDIDSYIGALPDEARLIAKGLVAE